MNEEISFKTPYEKSLKPLKEEGKVLDWENFLQEFENGNNEMVSCEIAYRAKQRAKILKMEKLAEKHDKLEKSHHVKSMEHLKKAKKFFKEANKKIDTETIKKYDEIAKKPENVKKIRTEVFEKVNQKLSETDIKPEYVSEITQIYEDTFVDLEKNGFSGIVDRIDTYLDELVKQRSNLEKNRGREHRSPLAWWKYFVIAGIIGALAAVVIALWYTGGWTLVMIWGKAIGAAILAVIGYIIYLLVTGC